MHVRKALISSSSTLLLSHTSIALRDALLGFRFPSSKCICPTCMPGTLPSASCFSDIARGVIVGLGAKGYRLALIAAVELAG